MRFRFVLSKVFSSWPNVWHLVPPSRRYFCEALIWGGYGFVDVWKKKTRIHTTHMEYINEWRAFGGSLSDERKGRGMAFYISMAMEFLANTTERTCISLKKLHNFLETMYQQQIQRPSIMPTWFDHTFKHWGDLSCSM